MRELSVDSTGADSQSEFAQRVAREFQLLAGELIWAEPDALVTRIRYIVDTLHPADRVQSLMLRGLLLEVVLRWQSRIHATAHSAVPDCCFARFRDELESKILALQFTRTLTAEESRHDRDHALAAQLKSILDARYNQLIDLADVAKIVGCHKRKAERVFRAELGESMHSYLLRRRIDKAMQMIRQTDLKIEAIAHAVGFRSRTSLYRALRPVTNEKPSALRRPL